MNQIEYIADGYNKNQERVVLWRLGDYQYQLEVAGKNTNFSAEYYGALDRFSDEVGIDSCCKYVDEIILIDIQ